MAEKTEVRVLFVCMGNICRSPTAQGIFEQLVEQSGLHELIRIDSAGTHAYHVGEPPDERATQAARRRGVDLSTQRARRVSEIDFHEFDYLIAMDQSNFGDLLASCPGEYRGKIRLLLDFAGEPGKSDVPDPYYGGGQGFERVLDLVEEGARGLLDEIRSKHLAG